ncbi:hypothetical protein PUN28_012414 [Cardiocondyla obscurior]|uniref:Uncharacterized protein n=1 Tax=Cardiocondyla obscurior TaxID=286306 RepID=A0AAW2FE76_9HYME
MFSKYQTLYLAPTQIAPQCRAPLFAVTSFFFFFFCYVSYVVAENSVELCAKSNSPCRFRVISQEH